MKKRWVIILSILVLLALIILGYNLYKIQIEKNYICPDINYINCIPPQFFEKEDRFHNPCYGQYSEWIDKNCPNIKKSF